MIDKECCICNETKIYDILCENNHIICINCFEQMTLNIEINTEKRCPLCRSIYTDIYNINQYEFPQEFKFLIDDTFELEEIISKIEKSQLEIKTPYVLSKYNFIIIIINLCKLLKNIRNNNVFTEIILYEIIKYFSYNINNYKQIHFKNNLNNIKEYLDKIHRKKIDLFIENYKNAIINLMHKLLKYNEIIENYNNKRYFITYFLESLILYTLSINKIYEDDNTNNYLNELKKENTQDLTNIDRLFMSNNETLKCYKYSIPSVTYYDVDMDMHIYKIEYYKYDDYIKIYNMYDVHLDNWCLPKNNYNKIWFKNVNKIKKIQKEDKKVKKYNIIRKMYLTKCNNGTIKFPQKILKYDIMKILDENIIKYKYA